MRLDSRAVTGAAPSRRAAAFLTALAALAALAISACGGSSPAHTPSTTAVTARTFIDLVPALPANLDETGTPDVASTRILPAWASELVRPAGSAPGPRTVLPPDDAVVPYLATSWRREQGGDYVFRLRHAARGVTGNPLSAADVRWSLERAVARSPLAPFLFRLAHIDAANPVTILGPHRVRINVTAPSPLTLSVLASATAAIYDSRLYRSHATSADPWAQVWGSTHSGSFAAYWVESFTPREEIVLAANPGFWRHPYYTHVIIRGVAGSNARLSAVLAGDATHTASLDWADFSTAATQGPAVGVRAQILQDGPGVIAWQLNVRRGPLANPLVRQAINLGVNRSILAGDLDLGYDTPSVLTIPAIFGRKQPTIFDPVQARSLMRAAGYPAGIDVGVLTNETVAGSQVGVLLHELYAYMIEIGVILHSTYVDNTDQLLALEANHEAQSSIDVLSPLLGGAAFLLEQNADTRLNPASPASDQGYANPTLQNTLERLRTSLPGPAADALIGQAAGIVDTDLPTINLATVPIQNVTRADVAGYAAYTEPVTYYEDLHPAP